MTKMPTDRTSNTRPAEISPEAMAELTRLEGEVAALRREFDEYAAGATRKIGEITLQIRGERASKLAPTRAVSAAAGVVAGALLIAMPFTKPMPAGAAILCVFIGGILLLRSLPAGRRA